MKDRLKKPAIYLLSATAAGVADIAVFSLLANFVFPQDSPFYTSLAAVIARVLSSVINFFLNCRYVFQGQPKRAVVRYYVLWTGQLCCSCLLVNLIGHGLGTPLTITKAVGDMCLGIISYHIQGVWVFAQPTGFYGDYALFARWLLRLFSPRYECDLPEKGEPAVYVCRHLNMHGPYTTIKWLPFQVHPMILDVFFDRKSAAEHLKGYTLSVRRGKRPRRWSPFSKLVGAVTAPLVRSLQGIPVHRGSSQSIGTLKTGVRYLEAGESLVVFPDIDYTTDYEHYSQIYEGFLYLGQLYEKRTGKRLRFVPLIIDDKHRRIVSGKTITVSDFRKDGQRAKQEMTDAINRIKSKV